MILLLKSNFVQAQEPQNWSLGGYIKDLQSLLIIDDLPNTLQENLLHNRLNFRWFPSNTVHFRADLRSRIFWGDLARLTPNYLDQINAGSDDFFDLSLGHQTGRGFVLHSTLDRLSFTFARDKWELHLGRQRINWGISGVWNPNDIFNAFSFTDFDYEERPGSDALRLQYFTGFASSIELAAKVFDTWEEAVLGMRWQFNKWNYDFQLIGGLVKEDISIGAGWAGNIKNSGFKGEVAYFVSSGADSVGNSFTGTMGWDYSFKKGTYLNLGFLYNSNGRTNGSAAELFNFELSAKNLYPYRIALFAQAVHPFSPLLNGSLALIYSPLRVHALFVNPGLTYSIQQNWDIDLIGQLVFEANEGYKSPVRAGFLRLKFSF